MGIKPVENRKWRPSSKFVGGDVAIHASAKYDVEGAAWILEHFADDPVVMDLVRGQHIQSAILGVVRLAGYMHEGEFYFRSFEGDVRTFSTHELMHSKWFFGKFGYVLDDVRTLPDPVIGVKGSLNFWVIPTDIEEEITRRLKLLEQVVKRSST